MVKKSAANAGDARNMGLIPGSRKSLGVGNGNPLQNSCLENSMDRGLAGCKESNTTECVCVRACAHIHIVPLSIS